jgi:preprotein translocase subunit Sec61beta
MAQEQKMQMPGVFGGLMRYGDEYKSKFMFSPQAVIGFVIAIIVFVLVLKIFFPVAG